MMSADPFADWSDEALAGLAARKPEDSKARRAAEILLDRYARTVYRWCCHMTGERQAAEDLAQDILLSAYRSLHRFEGWGSFSAWIFVISRNRCRDALRRRSFLQDEETEPDMLADSHSGPDQQLEDKEAEERLLILMQEHLSPLEQEALWLRCHEGMSIELITRLLEIPKATGARTVLQTARRKLRAALKVPARLPHGLAKIETASHEEGRDE